MIEQINAKSAVVFFQEGSNEMPIAEPAILIENYESHITLSSEGGYINLNIESLPEFIKHLKTLITK